MKNSRRQQFKLCLNLFWEFFKIGLFTIGGGMAMLPLIQKAIVDDRHWMEEEEMIDCLAISQALPGVIATNSATYVGKRIAGYPGSLAATLGVIAPSFVIIIAIVGVLDSISGNPTVDAALMGIKAAVCGLVVVTAVRMGKKTLKNYLHWVLAVTAFILIAVLDVTALWTIIIGAAVGVLYLVFKDKGGTES